MASPGPHKLDQNTEPVLLFSKDAFRQREESLAANILHHIFTSMFLRHCVDIVINIFSVLYN